MPGRELCQLRAINAKASAIDGEMNESTRILLIVRLSRYLFCIYQRSAPGIDPLAELDAILNEIKDAAETSSPRISPTDGGPTSNNAPTAITTSTGISGVGYEMGNDTTQRSRINESMAAAAAKQAEKDLVFQPLMSRLVVFIQNYDGSEGMVLLSLKMSRGFNRVLFDLLKNDSIAEWGT